MANKIEIFTVQNKEGNRFMAEKWGQPFSPLAGGTEQVCTYNLVETGEILRRHPTSLLGYENTATGELYIRIE